MNRNSRGHSLCSGILVAVISFISLSVFAGGIIEISAEVDIFRRVLEMAAYALSNKFVEKLIASMVLGYVAYFVSQMIAYGKLVSERKRAKATRLRFDVHQSDVGKTA